MPQVRIGCVKYLNTLPLVEGLSGWADAEIVSAVPARLIDMLMSGQVDLALASTIDAGRGGKANRRTGDQATSGEGGGVVLLPVGMIGSDGPTMTVRLFSRVPFERVTRVCVDTDSHTSAVLMRIVLAKKFGVRVEAIDYDAREHIALGEASGEEGRGRRRAVCHGTEAEAILLIGDKVVTDPPPAAEFPHQLDLGQAWKELTGLPFVYAVWMCRAADADATWVKAAAAVLDRQRRHNATRLDWIVSARAPERGWPVDQAAEYVGSCLTYEVGQAERQAVRMFLSMAVEMGMAETAEADWAVL